MLKTRSACVASVVLAFFVCECGSEELTTIEKGNPPASSLAGTTIPLDHVWSNGMPGTLSAREIGPESHELCDKIINLLIDASDKAIRAQKKANPGFIVEGTGLAALRRTEAILRTGNPIYEAGKESGITVVFFTCQLGDDVQLISAGRSGKKITISYCFVTHPERNTSISFALIPLGRLPVGKYSVEFQQMPLKERLRKIIQPKNPPSFFTDGSKYICQPFSFEVVLDKQN